MSEIGNKRGERHAARMRRKKEVVADRIAAATTDIVTEMGLVKHAFKAGVKAMSGIER